MLNHPSSRGIFEQIKLFRAEELLIILTPALENIAAKLSWNICPKFLPTGPNQLDTDHCRWR